MAGDLAKGDTGPAAGTVWEVRDGGREPMQGTTDQLLEMIAAGRMGFASQVRRIPESGWSRVVEQREFGYAFPYVNLPAKKPKGKGAQEPVGLIALNPDVRRALDVARELASDPKARNLNFFYSGHVDWMPAPLIRRSRLFQMWNGFWVAPVVDSSVVRPGGWLNLYLIGINVTEKEQDHTLRAGDADIPEGMRGNLSFALPPWSWAIQMVSVPAGRRPGFQRISFKTRSGAERAATAVAVGVLTLGSFVYAPGSAGFSLQFETLSPEDARIVDSWEAFAVQAADQRFEAAHATAISDGRGGRIAKDVVLQRFRPYLTPSLIAGIVRDKRQPPQQAFAGLLDEFLFDWLGLRGVESSFLPDGAADR